MIRLGYVAVNTQLPSSSRSFRLSNYSEERMLRVAEENLSALRTTLEWNIEHSISVFRITSHLIPFGSSVVNSGTWKDVLALRLREIGDLIRIHGMRVSMHPGQYTVLNTPNQAVLASTLRELEYHHAVFELMNLDQTHKIVLHGGGAYGDKLISLRILMDRIAELDPGIRSRIILENDERIFTAEEIYSVCSAMKIPGVFDVFHHSVLPSFTGRNAREVIQLFGLTWNGQRQKIHYSEQDPSKCAGSHSVSIDVRTFGAFLETISDLEIDIMLEVKDKQQSLLVLREAFPELK